MSAYDTSPRPEAPARRTRDPRDEPFLTIAAGHTPQAEIVAYPLNGRSRSRLFVRRLEIDARIGAYEHEKNRLQRIVIDLEFALNSELACHTDRLSDALDYAEVVARLRTLAAERHVELVEHLAETMALMLQREFNVPWLILSLAKLSPFPGAEVGVVIERGQRA